MSDVHALTVRRQQGQHLAIARRMRRTVERPGQRHEGPVIAGPAPHDEGVGSLERNARIAERRHDRLVEFRSARQIVRAKCDVGDHWVSSAACAASANGSHCPICTAAIGTADRDLPS